jgi:glycosyltransferase involved in cell wall biosynthesis
MEGVGMEKQLTVVIPAYNAHDTIERNLLSIISQTSIDKVSIIIVNDCSIEGYDDIVKKFKQWVDIELINLEVNGGPGVARQKGLEACKTPYVTFIDADDVYVDSFFMQACIESLTDNKEAVAIHMMFLQETDNNSYIPMQNDNVWTFGKVYRVANLRKKNIGFSELRSNEDLEFNYKIDFTLENNEQIIFENTRPVYIWKNKSDSITRINNFEYSFHTGIIGSIEAKIRAYEFSKNYPNANEKIKQSIATEIAGFYGTYIGIIYERPEEKQWLENVFEKMVEFYHNYGKEVWESISKEEQAMLVHQLYPRHQSHIFPTLLFHEFIEKLEAKQL